MPVKRKVRRIPRGRVTSEAKARSYVHKWIAQQTPTKPNQLVVGHLFNFALFKEFADSISELIRQGTDITGVRIYHAISNRRGDLPQDNLDLVLVPVLSNDKDYYKVYEKRGAGITPIIVAESTPCPNICSSMKEGNFNCPAPPKKTTRKK